MWRQLINEAPRRVWWSIALILVLGLGAWGASYWFSGLPTLPPPLEDQPQPVVRGDDSAEARQEALRLDLAPAALVEVTPVGTPVSPFLFHIVQPDETLIAIAAQYDVTTEALLVANEIRDPTDLQTGQPLLIPPEEGEFQQKVVLHQVKKGETMLGIASRYGSSLKDIKAANPSLNFEALPPGQTVAIPLVFAEATPVIEADEEAQYHVVERGEVPLTIAAGYDIPVEVLLSANEITDPRRLRVGQKLLIPAHDGISLGFPVILYELMESDTLVGIASRFGSSVKDILAVNPDLDPAELAAGQLVAVPVIFGLPKSDEAPAGTPAPPPPPPPSRDQIEQQVIAAVNAQREQQGLSPFEPNPALAAVALAHAQDMYVRDFFAHVSPDGQSLEGRLRAGGINDFMRAGENIQRNTQPAGRTAQAAVNWFMNSPPHRANILHPFNNQIGVGVVEGPPGWYTFVLNFAQR